MNRDNETEKNSFSDQIRPLTQIRVCFPMLDVYEVRVFNFNCKAS